MHLTAPPTLTHSCTHSFTHPPTHSHDDVPLRTRETGARNGVAVQVVRGDLFAGTRLPLPLDVLIFNPPYVPTPNDEVGGDGIEASWAGGECGREVIDRFLPLLPSLLAPPRACAGAGAGAGAGVGAGVVEGGVCYMILVEDNKPADVMAICTAMGLEVGHDHDGDISRYSLKLSLTALVSNHNHNPQSLIPNVSISHGPSLTPLSNSQFPIPNSQFPIPNSQSPSLTPPHTDPHSDPHTDLLTLQAKIIRTKRARNELLHVVRVQRVLERQQGHGPSVFAAATAAAAVA